MLPPSLFNLYVEFITQNARLYETGFGIKFAGRNINNLRYTYDKIHMEEIKKKKEKAKDCLEERERGEWKG